MSLTREERSMGMMLKDPRFPTGCVEGTFKGERAVFICLMEPAKKGGFNMTPIARLLGEDDMAHVKGAEDEEVGDNASKIVLATR